jgi:flagellar protein FliO/FliZ
VIESIKRRAERGSLGRGGAEEDRGDMGAYLLSTTLALAVVCALAVGLLKALGRKRPEAGARLRVIERLPLEARRSLYLVEAGGRHLLVGVGDGAMTTLAELDPAAGEAVVTVAPPPAPGWQTAFASALRRVVLGAGSGR